MTYRIAACLLFLGMLALSCTDREELFQPDIPGQHITLELADGSTLAYTKLRTNENLSTLWYRFDSGNPTPGELYLSRAGRGPLESVQLSGAFPLRSEDFDAEGLLREGMVSLPREAEMGFTLAQDLTYCNWTTTVRFDSWSAGGILSGRFMNTATVNCPLLGPGIVTGSFSVYVSAIRQN